MSTTPRTTVDALVASMSPCEADWEGNGRMVDTTPRTLAAMVPVTPSEGRAELCSWCSSPSVVKVVDHSWLDYACQAHAIEWYPTEFRSLVPPTDMVKVLRPSAHEPIAPWVEMNRVLVIHARHMIARGHMEWLRSEFRMRANLGMSMITYS